MKSPNTSTATTIPIHSFAVLFSHGSSDAARAAMGAGVEPGGNTTDSG